MNALMNSKLHSEKNPVNFQHVTTHSHHNNADEPAIQDGKTISSQTSLLVITHFPFTSDTTSCHNSASQSNTFAPHGSKQTSMLMRPYSEISTPTAYHSLSQSQNYFPTKFQTNVAPSFPTMSKAYTSSPI